MRYIAIFVLCFGIAFGVDCAAQEESKDMQSSERDGALIRKAMIEFFTEPEKDTYGDFLEEVQRNRAVVNDYGFLIIGPWVYEKDTNEMVRYLDPEQWAGYEYETTQAGHDLILQVLNPDKARVFNETQDIISDYKDNMKRENVLKEIRPGDLLEYLYENSDKWRESENPVESIKTELKEMIKMFKEEKFSRMQIYLPVLS